MEVGKGRARSAGRLIGDVLDAWVSQSLATWAPSSARDQQSQVKAVKADPIERIPLAHGGRRRARYTRLRHAGLGDATVRNQHGVLRAALAQAVRWAWAASNMASLARLRSTNTLPRRAMTLADVQAVIVAAALIRPVGPSWRRCRGASSTTGC
jgi:hypothetical protein